MVFFIQPTHPSPNISCQGTPDTGVDGIWFMAHGIVKAKMEKKNIQREKKRQKRKENFAKIERDASVVVRQPRVAMRIFHLSIFLLSYHSLYVM